MTSLDQLRDSVPDFAKDIRLNLGTVLSPEGAPDLTLEQIHSIALACAYASRLQPLIAAMQAITATALNAAAQEAAKSAASIMAMNNVYYRFVHFLGDSPFKTMPAKLRMNVIGNPGVAKLDFELMCLAVSAMNGCGMCVESHVHEVQKAGLSQLGTQSCVRIAATIAATAQALIIAENNTSLAQAA